MRQSGRLAEFLDTYTKDLKAEDLQRLFTRDTREAYNFFARHLDFASLDGLPRHRRWAAKLRLLFFAFTLRLSPARRVVYGAALFTAAIGLFDLLRLNVADASIGPVTVVLPGIAIPNGAGSLIVAFVLMNLLVLLEVADRLSLKNDLEIAREIQQAMLPDGIYRALHGDHVGTIISSHPESAAARHS